MVTQTDLDALHEESGMTVFLGVEAGDHLIYIGESGHGHTDRVCGADQHPPYPERPDAERDAYLRRQQSENADLVSALLSEYAAIKKTRIATNLRHHGTQLALATVVRNHAGAVVALRSSWPCETRLRKILLKHVDSWPGHKVAPLEVI